MPGPGGHLESPRQAFMVGSLSAPLIMVAKLGDLPEIRAGLLRMGLGMRSSDYRSCLAGTPCPSHGLFLQPENLVQYLALKYPMTAE